MGESGFCYLADSPTNGLVNLLSRGALSVKKSQYVARIILALAILYWLYRDYQFLAGQLVVANQNDWSPDQIIQQVVQAAFYAVALVVAYFAVAWLFDGLVGLFKPATQGKCPSCGRPFHLEENFCPQCGEALKPAEAKAVTTDEAVGPVETEQPEPDRSEPSESAGGE